MTSHDKDLIEAKKVVRTFSWKTFAENPNDDLAGALVAVEALDIHDEEEEETLGQQWRELFDPAVNKAFGTNREGILLASQTDELAKAYKAFQKCLPKGHEARIEDGPPRMKAVVEAVANADVAWKNNRESTKAGRMKTLFGKVCTSLNGHKNLFAILPNGDKYICLVTGSITAIVKATVNHDKIAEGVSSALDDLSDDINYWHQTLQVYKESTLMKDYVARLYVVVFNFLIRIMTKWSKSSIARFLRSFDSSFFKDEIEDKKAQMRDLEHRLEREGSLSMKRSVKEAPTKDDIAKIVAVSQANFEIEFLLKAEQLRRELGQTVVKALHEEFLSSLWLQRDDLLHGSPALHGHLREPSPMSMSASEAGDFYLREQVELTARRLLPLDDDSERVQLMIVQSRNLNLNIHIFERIREWNSAMVSRLLWIQGPFQVPTPSRYTLLGSYVLATAERASIPAVSYFCERGTHTTIAKLVQSLIVQLTHLIPHDFSSELGFTPARFERLDGTDDSAIDAIHLLRDLLTVGPYILYVIIDGLHILDTASNVDPLGSLIETLRSASRSGDTNRPRTIKTLFTTDGMVQPLSSLLNTQETINTLDFAGEDDGSGDADSMEVGFL